MFRDQKFIPWDSVAWTKSGPAEPDTPMNRLEENQIEPSPLDERKTEYLELLAQGLNG